MIGDKDYKRDKVYLSKSCQKDFEVVKDTREFNVKSCQKDFEVVKDTREFDVKSCQVDLYGDFMKRQEEYYQKQ